MSNLSKILFSMTIGLLLLSVTANGGLLFYILQQNNLARELRTEVLNLRQERDKLQQEVEQLRAQSLAPTELNKTLDTIAHETEELRDLPPLTPINRHLVSQAEMGKVVKGILAQEYPPADRQRDQIVEATLGLIPPDLDLGQTMDALLAEQVAGLYDPASQTLYVVQYGQNFGGVEKVTFSHEHTHALQDQHFNLRALGLSGDDTGRNADQLLAIQAVAEGDATFTMQQYMQKYFTSTDLWQMVGAAFTMNQAALNQAPPYLRHSLMFPYQDGMTFISTLYYRGGWAAVDKAFTNPPQSSEQILHSQLYPQDQPQTVTLPPLTTTLGADWYLITENVLGEFTLREYLDTQLTLNQAIAGADGWGGDHYAVYQNGAGETVLVMSIVWDSAADESEFTEIYQQYAQARLGQPTPLNSPTHGFTWHDATTSLMMTTLSETHTVIIQTPPEIPAQQILTALISRP
jgi:hypothetical protein